MGLNKPEQDLKRDLQGVASDLKWSAVELLRGGRAGRAEDVRCIPCR